MKDVRSGLRRAGPSVCVMVVCVALLAGCQAVVQKAAPAIAIGIARILIEQDGKITLEQAAGIVMTEVTGAVGGRPARTGPAGPVPAVPSGAPGDWTIEVRRQVDGAARTSTYRVSSDSKLHVLTNGRTAQTFEPGRNLITIHALPGTPTTIAVVDSLDQPVRSKGKFRLMTVGSTTDYDFDTDKRSGGSAGSDLRAEFGGPVAAHGAVYAKYKGTGEPSMADCVTVRPDEWRSGLGDASGTYCMRTSESRFGRLGISTTMQYSYTVWETTSGTGPDRP